MHDWLDTLAPEAAALLHAALAHGLGSAAAVAVAGPDGRQLFVNAGRTSRTRHVGASAREHPRPGTPVGPRTRFDLASVSKPMATLTLLAQELSRPAPRIRLDQALAELLPEARGTVRGAATVAQLVSHASGAPAWLDLDSQTARLAGRRERCGAIVQEVLQAPVMHEPGSAAIYSDLGYMALGWMLEAVFQLPLDQLFVEHIAAPLGGIHASYRRLPAPLGATDDIAATEIWPRRCPDGAPIHGAVHDDNCAALGGVAGHAGLFATSAAVLSWAVAWLGAVTAQGSQVQGPLALAPDLARRLVTTAGAPGTSWRHGWDTPSQPGSSAGSLAPADAFGHLGYAGTSVWLAPSLGTAVVLLTNRVHPTHDDTARIRALRPSLHDAVWRSVGPAAR